jgi:manganese transport protein
MPNEAALYIAIGIMVMPHNLYLHSSLVQTRKLKELRWNQAGFEIQFHRFYHCIKLSFFSERSDFNLAAAHFIETECLKWPRFRMHIVF